MNKFLVAAVALPIIFSSSTYGETIEATDGRITYIGRTQAGDGAVSFDWTGTYARVRFQGKSLSFKVSDTKKNYYNVWLDGSMDAVPDKVLAVHGTDTTITIFSPEELKAHFGKDRKAAKEPHQAILQKRTEGEQGMTRIFSFTTDGTFLQADAPKGRVIEYVGDSYTCGYGTEASNKDRFSPETENQNLTYACMAARYFDAEQIVIAHSGMGVARNYNGNLKDYHMPDLYTRTFDMDKDSQWDAKACPIKPDVTVVYLGTNDFSTGSQPAERLFVKNYIQLLGEIKGNYGEGHPILCIAPKHDPLMLTYIGKAVETCGMRNVHLLGLNNALHNNVGDMGADGHPNHGGHTKLAYTVIPYISTITGWEMAHKVVK